MKNQADSTAIIRIPLREIERIYGRDNLDNAGDDIVHAIREVSEWPDEYRYRFDFDRSHTNPWYHAMVVSIDDFPDSVRTEFFALLTELGLDPNGITN